MANEAAKDTPATPERLRGQEIFTKHLETVQNRDAKNDQPDQDRKPARAREDVTEPEARGANDDDGQDGDSDELDLADLPEHVQARIRKLQKSLKGDYTRKTQKLSEERKSLEARLRKLEAWEPTIDRYQTLDEKRRERARKALLAEDEDAGRESEQDEDAELNAFLESLEEDGRPLAKTHIDLSVKRAVKAMAKENQALLKRVEQLEADAIARQRAAQDHGAQSELAAFKEHVPDYGKLPEKVRVGFERFAKAFFEDSPNATLIDAWNDWEEINEERASRKTTETVQKLATRAQEAPLRSSSLAGSPTRPKFKSQREAFDHHARRNNIRV